MRRGSPPPTKNAATESSHWGADSRHVKPGAYSTLATEPLERHILCPIRPIWTWRPIKLLNSLSASGKQRAPDRMIKSLYRKDLVLICFEYVPDSKQLRALIETSSGLGIAAPLGRGFEDLGSVDKALATRSDKTPWPRKTAAGFFLSDNP